jgi:miniconductance mechanosensitive channel
MIETISNWLVTQNVGVEYLPYAKAWIGSAFIFILCGISYYISKHQLLVMIQKIVSHSKNTWDDLLLEHKVFNRIALLTPFLFLWFLTPHLVEAQSILGHFFLTFAKIAISFQVARSIGALLNVIKSSYKRTATEKYLPLNSSIQVIKLIVYIVAAILSISYILGKSPFYLLSGLGALTAVLLLVFQDTIKGLVASIQISANKMVAPGDWVELPTYGADGDVLEIGLNTVKVKNFDNTITTVPTYALISGSFRNWRGMMQSGGRRIKRSVIIDISSVKFYQKSELDELVKIRLLTQYLETKTIEINESRAALGLAPEDLSNSRQLTNIGTFRAYISAYLTQHPKIHTEMTCMVRQLASTESGIPLELYCFSNDKNWVNYENIQADIFDHIFAMAPLFGLRIFQHPTGNDWKNITNQN